MANSISHHNPNPSLNHVPPLLPALAGPNAIAPSIDPQQVLGANASSPDVKLNNLPVCYFLGNSDIGKSSVCRLLMNQSVSNSVDPPKTTIIKNSPGGLDAVINAGKNLITADFARCPANVVPAEYAAQILAEIKREGTKVPSEAQFLIVLISADIGKADYIKWEIDHFHAILSALRTQDFIKPFFVIFNCHESTHVKRHDVLVDMGKKRFADITSKKGVGLCEGVFAITAAPCAPLNPECPRSAHLPKRDQHLVDLRAGKMLRYCKICNIADVCSGAVEIPEVAEHLRKLKEQNIEVKFVVYRTIGMEATDPFLKALEAFCLRPSADPTIHRYLKFFNATPVNSLSVLPSTLLAYCRKQKDTPLADIDRSIFHNLVHIYEIPLDMQQIVEEECYQKPEALPDWPLVDNGFWDRPLSRQLDSLPTIPALSALVARAAFHTLRLWNVRKALELIDRKTSDITENDKRDIAASASAAINPSLVILFERSLKEKGVSTIYSLAKRLESKWNSPCLWVTKDFEEQLSSSAFQDSEKQAASRAAVQELIKSQRIKTLEESRRTFRSSEEQEKTPPAAACSSSSSPKNNKMNASQQASLEKAKEMEFLNMMAETKRLEEIAAKARAEAEKSGEQHLSRNVQKQMEIQQKLMKKRAKKASAAENRVPVSAKAPQAVSSPNVKNTPPSKPCPRVPAPSPKVMDNRRGGIALQPENDDSRILREMKPSNTICFARGMMSGSLRDRLDAARTALISLDNLLKGQEEKSIEAHQSKSLRYNLKYHLLKFCESLCDTSANGELSPAEREKIASWIDIVDLKEIRHEIRDYFHLIPLNKLIAYVATLRKSNFKAKLESILNYQQTDNSTTRILLRLCDSEDRTYWDSILAAQKDAGLAFIFKILDENFQQILQFAPLRTNENRDFTLEEEAASACKMAVSNIRKCLLWIGNYKQLHVLRFNEKNYSEQDVHQYGKASMRLLNLIDAGNEVGHVINIEQWDQVDLNNDQVSSICKEIKDYQALVQHALKEKLPGTLNLIGSMDNAWHCLRISRNHAGGLPENILSILKVFESLSNDVYMVHFCTNQEQQVKVREKWMELKNNIKDLPRLCQVFKAIEPTLFDATPEVRALLHLLMEAPKILKLLSEAKWLLG